MVTTTGQLVSTTERHLLAGDRDEINQLVGTVDGTVTTFSFGYQLNGLQPGAYIGADLELCYVWSVDDAARTAVVQRGMVGSIPATHGAGTMVYVNPKFSKFDILQAMNVELADISPDLFQVKEFDLVTQPVSNLYPVPDPAVLDVLEVSWLEPGAEVRWRRVRPTPMPMRMMPTTGEGSSATGTTLRIMPPGTPGRPMRVRYSAPFSPLGDLSEDAATVSGLPVSSLDIPPLGAAARLMGVRGAKRTFTETAYDTRRAAEVPVGAASQAAGMLFKQVEDRIRSEVQALRKQWPDLR